jgi:hypothetical protein
MTSGMGTDNKLMMLLMMMMKLSSPNNVGSQSSWRNLTSNGEHWRIRHERETSRRSGRGATRSCLLAIAVGDQQDSRHAVGAR